MLRYLCIGYGGRCSVATKCGTSSGKKGGSHRRLADATHFAFRWTAFAGAYRAISATRSLPRRSASPPRKGRAPPSEGCPHRGGKGALLSRVARQGCVPLWALLPPSPSGDRGRGGPLPPDPFGELAPGGSSPGRPSRARQGRQEALIRLTTLRSTPSHVASTALRSTPGGLRRPLLLGAIAHKQKWSPASPRGDTSRPEALIRLTYPSVALPPHKTFAASSLSGGVRRPRAPGKEALRRRPSRARQGRKHSFGSLL